MEDLKTVIEVHSEQNGTLIGVARTRRELEQLIGGQASSRNEHGGWRQSDPDGEGSLDDLDEVATGFVRGGDPHHAAGAVGLVADEGEVGEKQEKGC